MRIPEHVDTSHIRMLGNADFFGKQLRITLRNCGVIDPESFDDYLEMRGYEALAKVLENMTPEQVIEEIEHSGLRGRGGGGYPDRPQVAADGPECQGAEC